MRTPAMYYDDQTRRFNVLSGLIFGTVLGAGLALIAAPARGGPARRSLRRSARAAGGGMAAVGGRLREQLRKALPDAPRRGRGR